MSSPQSTTSLPVLQPDFRHQLYLKELQVNRLLAITQAINNNAPASQLFEMYTSFLSWDMDVTRMALFIRQGGRWVCAASIGLEQECAQSESAPSSTFARYTAIDDQFCEAGPLFEQFSVIIPVAHKQLPLAYVLLGSEDGGEPIDHKTIQFVAAITNVIAVAIENKRLFNLQLEQERYRAELALASDIQRSLVPGELPATEAFEMAAIYEPLFGVGGDFFSAEVFPDGKLLFCVADIAGKGTGAALLMSNFEASFWSLARLRSSLEELVDNLNEALFRVTRGDRFLTMFIGEFDPERRELRYINAGHNPPLLTRFTDEGDTPVEQLREGCTFLGAFETLPVKDTGLIALPHGGKLLAYTDGATELVSPSGDMFGEERLARFVATSAHDSATVFNEKLLTTLSAFRGEQAPTDDLTILSVSFR